MELIFSLYQDEDLVCVVTIPEFMGRKQRFVRIADLKADKWQRFLRAANAKGSNIYLSVYCFTRPERTEDSVVDTVDRIFLDFDSLAPYTHFREDYQPSVVIQTSPGKYQCLLLLSESLPKWECKNISETLSKQYGADKTFDLARTFRVPGFRNCKYSERPIAELIEFKPGITYSGYRLSVLYEAKEPIQSIVSYSNNSIQRTTRNGGLRNLHDYDHFLEKAPLKVNGEPDYSSADFSYAVYLFNFFDSSEVRSRLENDSFNLKSRKKGGLINYLNKTIERAGNYQKQNYREKRVGAGE